MKLFFNSLLLLTIFLLIACNNNNKKDPFSGDSPKEFAQLTNEIASQGATDEGLRNVFEKYGYNLTSGSRKYNEAYDIIKSDPEKYNIYQQENLNLLITSTLGKIENEKKEGQQ